MRWLAVPARTPELLVVRIERGRRVRVQHPAHVRLIDSHAERDRRRDGPGRALKEGGHRLAAVAPGKPGVVERHLLARCGERVMRRLRAGMRRRVDDPGAGKFTRRAHHLVLLVGERPHVPRREVDVRPVEIADHDLGITQAEPPHDLLPHRRRGRGGQGQANRRADRLGLGAEPHVVGTEVVAPLADQVGLIDHEQPGPGALQRLPGLAVGQLFRCEKDERAGVTRGQQRGCARTGRLLRVEDDRWQPGRMQVRDLIILQRDQR